MRNRVAYLIIRWLCKKLLSDMYVLLNCDKRVDSQGKPYYYYFSTNIGQSSSLATVFVHIIRGCQDKDDEESALIEVKNLIKQSHEK